MFSVKLLKNRLLSTKNICRNHEGGIKVLSEKKIKKIKYTKSRLVKLKTAVKNQIQKQIKNLRAGKTLL